MEDSGLKRLTDRLQRVVRAKAQADTASNGDNQEKQRLILTAMKMVRDSFNEIATMDLGPQFTLTVKDDDWGGWPRSILILVDTLHSNDNRLRLTVEINDRMMAPILRFFINDNINVAFDELKHDRDLTHVKLSLKKALHQFLDLVAKKIEEAPSIAVVQAIKAQDVAISSQYLQEESKPVPQISPKADISKADLFTEVTKVFNNRVDSAVDGNAIKIPELFVKE